jgi:phage terminase small subunit
MRKLTRKQITEGLEQVPINQILLGSNHAGVTLTKKQKVFAEELVKTGNKSASYRKAYNTKGKPETAARDSLKVAQNPKVSTYIQALEAAKEAETYLVPARLRTLAIHRLTNLALNDEIAPAQQLKALELIGKMTEVALFTERRELIQTSNSETMREQLLNSIRLAISSEGATDVEAIEVDSLLDEINGTAQILSEVEDYAGEQLLTELVEDSDQPDQTASQPDQPDDQQTPDPALELDQPDPLHPDPLFLGNRNAPPLHSIPHTQSPPKTKTENNPQSNQGVSTVTPVTLSINPNKDTPPSSIKNAEGEGV